MTMVANKLLTLVFVRKEAQILLGLKKRGFGMGRWNGFGGKVEKGETIVEAAKRELQEESGLTASSLEQIGVIKFEFVGQPQWLEVHVFETYKYEGEMTETQEMCPQWYDIDSIPFNKMWPDDKSWFPLMLKGAKFNGYYLFEGMDKILKEDLKEVEKINV